MKAQWSSGDKSESVEWAEIFSEIAIEQSFWNSTQNK